MGGLVLFVAGWRRSSDAADAAVRAGLRIFVSIGVVVLLVAGSGLLTASLLAEAAWLDSAALAVHRQIGFLTLVVLMALGGCSGVMLLASRTTQTSRTWAIGVLLLAVTGIGTSMWTAYLGGALRHTELGRRPQASTSRRTHRIPLRHERGQTMKAERAITVHRFEASLFPVNAYLIETSTSVVVV